MAGAWAEWHSVCGIQGGLIQTHFRTEPHQAIRYVAYKGNCGSGHPPLPVYMVCLIKQVKDIVRFSPCAPTPSDWILLSPVNVGCIVRFLSGANCDL